MQDTEDECRKHNWNRKVENKLKPFDCSQRSSFLLILKNMNPTIPMPHKYPDLNATKVSIITFEYSLHVPNPPSHRH